MTLDEFRKKYEGVNMTALPRSKVIEIATEIMAVTVKEPKWRAKHDVFPVIERATGVSTAEIMTDNRKKNVIKAKRLAIYMLRIHYGLTTTQIARMVNVGDHTTVVHHIKRHSRLMAADSDVADETHAISKAIIDKIAIEKKRVTPIFDFARDEVNARY